MWILDHILGSLFQCLNELVILSSFEVELDRKIPVYLMSQFDPRGWLIFYEVFNYRFPRGSGKCGFWFYWVQSFRHGCQYLSKLVLRNFTWFIGASWICHLWRYFSYCPLFFSINHNNLTIILVVLRWIFFSIGTWSSMYCMRLRRGRVWDYPGNSMFTFW